MTYTIPVYLTPKAHAVLKNAAKKEKTTMAGLMSALILDRFTDGGRRRE